MHSAREHEVRYWTKEADIIGLVADLTKPMWEQTVVAPRYRCIIPITHFGNPDGDAGAKTRTWFALKDQLTRLETVPSGVLFSRGTGPVVA